MPKAAANVSGGGDELGLSLSEVCFHSLKEIDRWRRMTDDECERVMADLPRRRALAQA